MIDLYIHPKKYTSKPEKMEAGLISSTLCDHRKQVPFDDLVKAISNGQTYCPSIFKPNVRKAAKWKDQQVFVADIDEGNKTLPNLLSVDIGIKPAIVHESFSSTPECRKWRVIFISKTPVVDPVAALALLRKIRQGYDGDRAIVDLARMLYGCRPDQLHHSEEVYFDHKMVDLEEFTKAFSDGSGQKEIEKLPQKVEDISKTRRKKAKLIKADVLRSFTYDKESSRYMLLWHQVRKLAQSNAFTHNEIKSIVRTGISYHGGYDDWDKSIEETMNNALNWGMKHVWEDDE